MERISWEKWASILFCFLAGGGVLILFWRYLLPILLPFLAAWLISLVIRPLAKKTARQFHLPIKLCAAILLTLFWTALILLMGLALRRVMGEMSRLLAQLLENNGEIPGVVDDSFDLFEFLMARLGIYPEAGSGYALFRSRFYEILADMSDHLIQALGQGLPTFAAKLLSSLPSAFFALLIAVIAGFYFCMEESAVTERSSCFLPRSVRARIPLWKARAKQISWRYVRVYLLLLALTFGELLIGFFILGVEYAFLLALVVAVLDMLPVLGVGTVLVPWALVAFFQKDFYLGFGLSILYLVMLIMRQIVEPKLLGRSLGLHPLLALFAGYAGFRLCGFFGMLAGPVAATLVKNALPSIKFFITGKETSKNDGK
jgi:sporulation integral membrane protein YtvI